MNYSMKTKLKSIYKNPVGHDILRKILLQMNVSRFVINNVLVGNLSLGLIKKIVGHKVDNSFFEAIINLLSQDSEGVKSVAAKEPEKRQWWKEAVFYQIYPRSFNDSDGDGVGDLRGIINKLDYLKKLGVNAVWLSPVYDSPNDDNGYDIRDYYKIMNQFGTMNDMDELIDEMHKRDMKLIMDLVVNHTSDEHLWFKCALAEEDSPYKDYYFFRQSALEPNNWTSFFSGSAWNYYKECDQWALHLFSKKQMDLNWENDNLREDIYKMIRWWLDKGVDGFRLDVINYISKNENLPNGDKLIGNLMGYYGVEHYFYGKKLHNYLSEMRQEAFEPYGAFSVGETPGIGIEMAKLLSAESRKELDMVFLFDHLEMPGKTRFDDYVYDLNYYKKYMIEVIKSFGDHCRASLFYDNHDNPRMVSKIDPTGFYRDEVAKLLAVMQLTLKGSPFIYQGQELAAVNKRFKSIQQVRDVESINLYKQLRKQQDGKSAFKKVLAGTRDHSRTPMQWSSKKHGGFSQCTPWIETDGDERHYNAEGQMKDRRSVWNFYRRLIKLRKQTDAFTYGSIRFIDANKKDLFCYFRSFGNVTYYIECNLSSNEKKRRRVFGKPLLSSYGNFAKDLRAYEANIFVLKQ